MIQITQLNMRPGHSLEDLKRKAAKTAGCSREPEKNRIFSLAIPCVFP